MRRFAPEAEVAGGESRGTRSDTPGAAFLVSATPTPASLEPVLPEPFDLVDRERHRERSLDDCLAGQHQQCCPGDDVVA